MSGRGRARVVRGACLVAIGGLLAGCGVPVDHGDRPLRVNEVAFTPRTEPTTTTATTAPEPVPSTTAVAPSTAPTTAVTASSAPSPTSPTSTPLLTVVAPTTPTPATVIVNAALDVYWVDRTGIAPIRRLTTEASVGSAIEALRAGPQPSDTDRGLRSAVPTTDMIVGAGLVDGTATVELASSFLTLPGTEQVLAIAQIVFTVTSVPGVVRVDFTLDGQPLAVPRADGQPASGAVSRQDYASLLVTQPLATGSTTTEPAQR